ncbi:MAG: GNAT family N-acetyltransferase [Coxiellaceae bacterium]|nr:GNAT family N-acetyltransferase [Coxiellaceae bacterium]
MQLQIEPLARQHIRNPFDCGNHDLNVYLMKFALQHQRRHINHTFVAVEQREVVGYYSLATGQINCDQLPLKMKHPKYPVSIVRISRLAVDKKLQGQGVGSDLLYHALMQVRAIADIVGIFAVVVDAKDDHAKQFYLQYGFVELQDSALTLLLMTKTIESL